MVSDEVGVTWHDKQWNGIFICKLIVLAQGCDPFLVSVCAFEGTINDRTLLHGPIVPFPSFADVQHGIQHREWLETLWRPPNNCKARRWDQLVNEIRLFVHARTQIAERHKAKPDLGSLRLRLLLRAF